MKIFTNFLLVIALCTVATAQVSIPSTKKLQDTAVSKVSETGDIAYKAAKEAFNRVVKDIPFEYASSDLKLNDPKYSIAGIDIDTFMKKTLIPALVKLVSLLPADKQVTIAGHACRDGSEEASGSYQGNIALSRARAQAMADYIISNSDIKSSRLKVVGNGSSTPKAGSDPASHKNCRVSIFID